MTGRASASERFAWRAYVRALALQKSEPGPETNVTRNAVFDVWQRAFLAMAST